MNPIPILLLVVLTLLAGCAGPETAADATKDKRKPNVLFIAVDDLNNLLGALDGYADAKTPNIDRLASRGVLFSNAHCQAPLCGPSRASIMTGLRPSTTGIYGMIPDDKIRSDNPATKGITLLPEYFRDNGYHTMGIGKLFHRHAPEGTFDESGGRVKGFGPLPPERFVWDGFGNSDRKNYGRTSTDWGAYPKSDTLMPDHQSVNWAVERLEREHDKPFFLGLGLLRVHVPLYVPQKWFDLYPLEDITTPPYRPDDLDDVPPVALKINDLPMMPSTDWAIESGEWPKVIQAYLACISFVDYEIGRVLDALDQSAYADNTVIVLWSDHGYRLGEKSTFAKHALWDAATKAPLLFAAPGLPEGKVLDEPAEMLSIYPTLLELCGLPAYARNEGKSLVPLMQGKDDGPHAAITTFGMNNHGVRTQRFRYISYEDGGEELYDHDTDPNEYDNLIGKPEYKVDIERLKQLLPQQNAKWDPNSGYNFQPYFVEQKARIGAAEWPAPELTNYDLTRLLALRSAVRAGEAAHQPFYRELLQTADKWLADKLYAVTPKEMLPPSGDKHDYISIGPYWWPDPDKPDGKPWIRRDGEVNPAAKGDGTGDYAKDQAFTAIGELAVAAWFSGEEKYAKRAVEQINTWFLDPATKINPNFNFAQGIPGRNDGRCFGIIEFRRIEDVVTALELLEHNGMLPEATRTGMRKWLTEMLDWLQTSKLGIEEGTRKNNHATCYDVQVLCLLRYLGRAREARAILETAKTKIIATQLEPDGRQPHELARTKSINYSSLNLKALTQLAWHGRELGVDLWNYRTADGRSIRGAYDYLKPYVFDGKPWEYEQLSGAEEQMQKLRSMFYRTGAMMGVPEFCALGERHNDATTSLEALMFNCAQ